MANHTEVKSDDTAALSAHGLTKHFPLKRVRSGKLAVHAVDNVDVSLHRGKVVALVGESGSGKSTIARLLAQLYPASAGEIHFNGQPVKVRMGRKFRQYCRGVQMIFQDPFASLNPVHTVRYILTRSLKIHHPGVRGGELETKLAALLEQVHLTPPERYVDKFPHELSGGQRQRIAIARALGARPQVLLADEPVSMLDVSIRLGVLNLLAELKAELDLAILYITHDIASARYFADETLVMYAGQVVERGGSENITQRPAHPYTQLLLASAPDPDALQQRTTKSPRGEPPSLISPTAGCRFAPRCPHVMDRCKTQTPPDFEVSSTQSAACWLYAGDANSLPEEP